ncbi:MAG TPA: hypothetical protein ENG59_01570 [Chloroflexi bacterium]|nr:MAG: hypothetical protein DRI46_07695 [Chloroflexota bacterium]HDD54917.1 hypothetical protein [Chloroflexota bacterium]
MKDQPYLHGEALTRISPLQSYLPGIRTGVVGNWLSSSFSAGDWVLCPFGSSPLAAVEAAQAGFRVLIPIHNPILRFLVKKLAAPPSPEDLNSALVKLASSYKGKERLKPHLLSLYETDCPLCGRKTSAVSFLWDNASRQPVSKICRCNACGEESVADVTEVDLKNALAFSDQSPTHARALTRVASPSDPIRIQVENALATYPPRSVYALFTALNKVTGFSLPEGERSHLEILLLQAFYRCSQTLMLSNSDGEQGTSEPGNYREENVWYAMEEALECWTGDGQSIPVRSWPEKPPESGGITIFPGRVKELIPQLIGFPIRAVVMVYPQPTPEFWSLSALWTGWLWGQEAAAPLRGILSSRDLDWPWMTHASQITLRELSEVLPDEIPALGLMPEVGTHSLLSWTSGSLAAGLRLQSLALDPDHRQAQSCWTINPTSSGPRTAIDHRALIRKAGLEALKRSGEPLHTLSLYSAGVSSLADAGYPEPESRLADAGEYYPQLLVDYEENIAYRQGFLHYPEIESWWHQELDLVPLTLSDRVEKMLVRKLLEYKRPVQESVIFQDINDAFPGLGTPRSGLVKACLSSYAEQDPDRPSCWVLKTNDQPASRKQDLKEMGEIITSFGRNLGYQVSNREVPENLSLVVWEDGGTDVERFYISASGLLGKIVTAGGKDRKKGWIILPGSRAGLIHTKLRQNPILAEALQENWKLIKYRHLRRLREQGGLTRANYQERFCLDPFTSDSPQLPLI